MTFNKVSDDKYFTVLDPDTEKDIREIFSRINLGTEGNFESTTNEALFNSIISRRIAAEFFKEVNELPKHGFATIDCSVGGKTLTTSVGVINYNESYMKVSGVYYK